MNVNALAYEEPGFEELTANKLAHYFIIFQECIDKLNARYNFDVAKVTPHIDAAGKDWFGDPTRNPSQFPHTPLTIAEVHAFYARCDAICNTKPHSTADLYRVTFAASAGVQFITQVLLEFVPYPTTKEIHVKGFEMGTTFMLSQPQHRAERERYKGMAAGEEKHPSQVVSLEDILSYKDDNDTIQTVRIKDHGSSAMKGEYYVVTSILDPDSGDGSGDQETSIDEMQHWLKHRAN